MDGTAWYWTVRQRVRPDYADCRLTLSFFTDFKDFTDTSLPGARRRLALVFAPGPDRIVSNTYLEAGTVVRLPDRSWLNLHEPGTARRLLDAAAPVLTTRPLELKLAVDGWSFFDDVVDRADPKPPHLTDADRS